MFKKIAFVITLLTLSSTSHARGIDIKLANEMAEFTYLSESSTFGYGGADIGFGLLFTEDGDYQINAKVLISGNPAGNNKALQFGIGGKLLYASIDAADDEVGALAIAGQLRYVVPSSTPIAFVFDAAYAPSITSFSSADNYLEYGFSVEVEVTPSARAYLGYRKMEYGFDAGGDFEVDNGGHIGIRFEF